ncbi:hypothetical protein BJF79_16515 [Actinomadura sp. CNU-125]|uniref:hypothetical protein n=1 Tax=Actinomadura sp. CNU-125 TaxID=1904961 RepID=UPI00095AA761|nr:hypothetical protein [Actinomadura sp. CNU-125]OLT19749.1 hypothetical protein BJF79_16515 [Actinomadura sp. CNU-125]
MRTIGTIVAIAGLASVVNHAMGGEQMEVLQWSDAHQPLAGIGLGVLGLLVFGLGAVFSRDR